MKGLVLLGLASAASAAIGPWQPYSYPDDADTMGENITSPKPSHLPGGMQADLLALLKNYRDDHGGCKDLQWDDGLVNDMYALSVNPDPSVSRCNDITTDVTGQYITSISYHMTTALDTASRPQPSTTEVWNDFLTRYADSVQIMKWKSATKIGCAYCEQTQWGKAYLYQLYCKITETAPSASNTVADNVLPSGSKCSACDGVTCPDQQCKQPGALCDIQLGGCNYINAQFGTTCDDNDASTKDDICDGLGGCKGTPLCQGVTCAASNDCEEQGTCDPMTGGCTKVLKADGTMCDDNNANTQDDKCQSGICKGTDKCAGVTCTAQSDCHEVGVCNPSTGTCTNPVKPVGTLCSDGDVGTVFDACNDMGVCVGQNLCANVNCPTSQCVSSGTCNSQTGACVYTNEPAGTPCDDGISYTDNDKCDSGVCKGQDNGCGQISCDTPISGTDSCRASGVCNGGACDWMYKAVGTPCVDDDDATVNDMCVDAGNGVTECRGVNKCIGVTCDDDQCNFNGKCNPADGTCTFELRPTTHACDDGIDTTVNDHCDAGVCRGTDLCANKDCSSSVQPGSCKEGVCDPATGMCGSADAPDGFGCDDGDVTTSNDVCMAGVCKGTDRCATVTCHNPNAGQCGEPTGRCDPTTGQCIYFGKVDGTPCDDGDDATSGDRCSHGVCVAGTNCGVEILENQSKTKCVLGKTYGFTPDGNFFVDDGCRAKVRIVANDHVITCESWGWKYKECPIFPKLPSCSTQDPEPCPSSTNCPGFTKLGEGRCVDKTDARFDAFILHNKDKAHCMAVAGSTADIAGVEYNPTTKDCVLLATNDKVLTGVMWDATELNHLGEVPISKTNNDADWMCWTPEDRCVGVVCQAVDDCHEVGVCKPQTGKCTSPPKCDGSFCDDNDPTTWNDQCTNGICQGQSGPKECWVPSSFWAGHKQCKKIDDAAMCSAYGSGSYQTEDKCCQKEFGGCSNSQVDSCWVAGRSWPEKKCKKVDGKYCQLPIGNWKTETECCAPGAAHVKGCEQKDNNDGVADKPEQCICDPSEFFGGVDEKTENYCASKLSPNGAGMACGPLPSNKKCPSDSLRCSNRKQLPKNGGAVCACGSFLFGAKNSHTRLCIDKSQTLQGNACFPSNAQGACSGSKWSICVTKVTITITIKAGRVSGGKFKGHLSIVMGSGMKTSHRHHGHSMTPKISVVSKCSKSRGKRGSRRSMKKSGCTMGMWVSPSRVASILDEEEEVVTIDLSEMSSQDQLTAISNMNENMEYMRSGGSFADKHLMEMNPELVGAINEMKEYTTGEIEIEAAPTDESEEDIAEQNEDESGMSSLLIGIIAAASGAGCLALVVAGVLLSRKNSQTSIDEDGLAQNMEFTQEAAGANMSEEIRI
eukprot:TRINITY_DN1074_c0_g1_i1.p1 TRINITY_DN1074_c0_g1~~TRINITY_DN1074_c0_g1_i1.p1  ORF type:complete len:1376 (+),score=388.89 TRINITY_DN1074_c0_g1_i1:61-4188(+)